MKGAAIEIQGLVKDFRLSHSGAGSLKTSLLWWKKRNIETLHVLKGLSFDVQFGECVALVGRNGAGKSTLLSLLSKVYKPTSGSIEIQGLVKDFRLSHSGAGSLKTSLLWWKKRNIETLHVLKGLSFDVQFGECVALVGRNGAGKSTLLSLLSKVYKPTSGSIEIHGRVAPLLELGAGFHPDLTGLENILFNGMILGLTRKQVMARIDQIVDFAELHSHIDSPIRAYSSGMLARLGFAVAVHVDAEILIVDEVLAVGDYAFEQKCYSFIDEFRKKGGTILFVSHNADAVRRVADRVVWLQGGEIREDGDVDTVLTHYLEAGEGR